MSRPLVIDTHTHVQPQALLDWLRDGGHPDVSIEKGPGEHPWLVHRRGLRYPLEPLFYDLDTKLEVMERDGIDVSLESASAPFFFYELEPDETLRLSQMFNEAVAERESASGGRIRGLATVPMNDPEAAAEELRRARDDLGLVGVEIGTSIGDSMLDDPALDPFFAAAEDLGMPVLLHPYRFMLGESLPPGLDRFFLSNLLGNSLETATAASRLVLGGVFDRHPGLTVQLVHGGGYFPYQLGRLQRGYRLREQVSEGAERPPMDYLDNFVFDTVIYERSPLEFLVSLVGSERVAFGTDHPFDFADVSALDVIGDFGEEAASAIASGNAARVYGLDSKVEGM